MFDAHASDNKKSWGHDRSLTIGASEAFQCLRRNFFTKRGYKPDPGFDESYGATERGTLLEKHYVVPVLEGKVPPDSTLLYAGDDQVTLIDGLLSATPDGLLKGLERDALSHYGIPDIEADCILIEIKSFDPRINLTEPKQVHAGQVQQQFGLVWSQTNHRPEYVVILYVNASWLDDIRAFVIKRDPQAYVVCGTRADMVYAANDPSDLSPEGRLRGGSECDYCPFASQCNGAQLGTMPVARVDVLLTDKNESKLRKLVKRDASISERTKELALMKAEVVTEIKAFLKSIGTRFTKTQDGYSASYTVVGGRKTYDMAAIAEIAEEHGIDLEDYTKVGDPSERLTVSAPKDKP